MSAVDLLPPGSWSPASLDAESGIAALEGRIGCPLPPDLRELHRRCRDVSLLEQRYRFLAPEAMRPVGELQAGDATGASAPRTWLAAIDLWDGNYVGVDVVANADGSHNWLDCDHENLGEADVIATSLSEFVREALACPDGLYWLQPGHRTYPRLKYEHPQSFWRRLHADWYAALGDECGPEACASAGCGRLRITHSVKCRRHHYDMVHGRACPFDDA